MLADMGTSMKYLPILQELWESDTIAILIIGAVMAVTAGAKFTDHRKCIKGMAGSIILYLICELLSVKHTNYLAEILLLFLGTAAIGGCIGFLAGFLIHLLKGR